MPRDPAAGIKGAIPSRATIQPSSTGSVKTLDTVLAEIYAPKRCDIRFQPLRSDTQSGEFHVLRTAQSFWATVCLGLELKLFRDPRFEGIVARDEVKAFRDHQNGFGHFG